MLINSTWQERFRALGADWDTYGAMPISRAAISVAEQYLLIAPLGATPYPHPNGGILIKCGDEEVIIRPDGTIEETTSD